MADAASASDQHANGGLRPRRPTRCGGDDDAGPLPIARVTLYHAVGCGLCGRAIEVVHDVQEEIPFELELVDIGGDPQLEARYRAYLPVIEVDGVRAFTYFLSAGALRQRLRDSS